MKRDYCDKCGKYDVIEEHHILPKAVFGNNNEIAKFMSKLSCEVPRVFR